MSESGALCYAQFNVVFSENWLEWLHIISKCQWINTAAYKPLSCWTMVIWWRQVCAQ